MSLCSQSLRAISRSRRPNTLLPFLYQTSTIQQWNPATRPNARRSAYSRSKPADDIPFADADGNLPPSVEEAQSTRKTTITDTERAAFEKLYKTFKAREHGDKEKGEHEELDQIADEYYEDDEEQKHTPLDKVFEELLYGKPQSKPGEVNRLKNAAKSAAWRRGIAIAPTASEESQEKLSPYKKKQLAAKAEKERIKKIRLEERHRIDALLRNAQTDRELWDLLETHVFSQLRNLNLDAPNPAHQKAKRSKPSAPTNDPKVRIKRPPPPSKSVSSTVEAQTLFANYPSHLVTALYVLQHDFPRSPLPHSLLPTIKSLGRSSYALGATTELYRRLIRAAWVQQSSYALVDTLLTDMDTNIVDFDIGILRMLDAVIREYDEAITGRMGREIKMVYGVESMREGIEKIRGWREVVAGKLGVPETVVEANVGSREREGRPVRAGTSKPFREGLPEWKRTARREETGRAWRNDKRKDGQSEDVPFAGGQGMESQKGVVQDTVEGETLSRHVGEEDAQLEQRGEETRDDDTGDRPAKVLL